jgi:DNA polymerase I-like protein with 3'-5' exonuclease and polymerase domains
LLLADGASTGDELRSSLNTRNLQQVPSHSELGKHIKRLFVARQGTLFIKVDYRVHEVRGWGLVAFDKVLAKVFMSAKALRDQYRLHPTKELAKRLKSEADIHIQNASYFFSVAIEKVDKPLRNAVKGVTFGLIYQMSVASLAVSIGKDKEYAQKLVNGFIKRFPAGMGWIERMKKHAQTHWFVEAPDKIRRHLWGYILPRSVEHANKVYGEMDRRSVNSPVQGMCSKFMMNGIRVLDRLIFKEVKKSATYQLFINNSVHDSLENEAGYANFLHSIGMIEWSLTEGVKKVVKERHGFDLTVDLEVDFEIGASLSQCEAWDFSVAQLDRLVIDSLLFQRNKLLHPVNVEAAYKTIFSKEAVARAPQWMQKQIANIGYSFELTEKSYIRELLNKGKALIADAEKIYGTDADSEKAKKGLLSEGNDLIEYAKELNGYRNSAG